MVKNIGSILMFVFRNSRKYKAFALVTSLILISLLSILTFNFAHKSRLNFRMSMNRLLSKKAEYYAYSGYNIALALLFKDTNSYDSYSDIWAQNIPAIPIDDGLVSFSIDDEKSKFNINSLVTPYGIDDRRGIAMFIRMLRLLNIDTDIAYSAADWEDKDSNALPMGAEGDYYMNLQNPYMPFNSPFITTGEILLVKGFKRDFYFLPPSRREVGVENRYKSLINYITVYGDGLININTASIPVLCSLSQDLTESVAEDIIKYRKEHPFKRKEDLKNVETISDLLYDEIDSLITVRSNIFRIKVRASVSDIKEGIDAVVMRQSRGVRVVYFSRSI